MVPVAASNWAQKFPAVTASLTPDQDFAGLGFSNLRLPVGGSANGTPVCWSNTNKIPTV